jgi:prophage antirepressor-like protein
MDILQTINACGHELPIYGTKEEPLFLALDVAKLIDYSVGHTSHMLNTVDSDEKLLATLVRSGQRREMWFLTEDGLYEVLMQSRKPIARRFKRSVKTVLKELRLAEKWYLEEALNHSDPLVDEWEAMCKKLEENGLEEITFAEFLISEKGYTEDMI